MRNPSHAGQYCSHLPSDERESLRVSSKRERERERDLEMALVSRYRGVTISPIICPLSGGHCYLHTYQVSNCAYYILLVMYIIHVPRYLVVV